MNKILSTMKKDNLRLRKEHNKDALILGTLISEIQAHGKSNGNRETTEEETLRIIKKFRKNAKDTLKLSGNPEIEHEIEIYSLYLPKEMSERELTEVIREIFKDNKNMGAIMMELKTNYTNYDGKMASKICKNLLNM